MAGNRNDRIRRVLSDGVVAPRGPAPRRLREVLPAPAGEADNTDDATPADATRPSLDPELKRRLEALGVSAASSANLDDRRRFLSPGDQDTATPLAEDLAPPAVAPDAPPWPEPGSVAPGGEPLDLAELLAAGERTTGHGAFLQVERRIPLALDHGRVPLADALAHPIPLRPHERGPGTGALLDAREAVFIDTETSGLSGGTGTVAFLVGAGWVEDDAFVVRQYFMRDYPEEGALLEALREDLGDRPLVSFNGRSFDWPLLTTRWRLNRHRPGPRTHFDLLPPARRLWGRTLHSHSLSTLERHVLGLGRGEDMPGYMIPGAWFDYLRSGHGATLAAAFRHNEIDVVSMLALFARVGAILADPVAAAASPGDSVGTARLLMELHEPERARRCLEVGLAASDDTDERPIRRMLGHMYRRAGEWQTALDHWLAVASGSEFDAEAHEQVAKLYEHRLADFGEALRWTHAALEQAPTDSRIEGAFEHRRARLERRIARSGQ